MAANFVISEFLADNDGLSVDNYGLESDWIEIHNSGDASGSLAGYYLTDNQDSLTKWQFPDVSIPAGGYLLVYASGMDDINPGQPLHTNFSLAKQGEYLGLVAPDGTTVVDDFGPQYPPQRSNVSYGDTGQILNRVQYASPGSAAKTLVPTNSSVDGAWTAPGFTPDGSWINGTTGVGYGQTFAGFSVRTYQANTSAGSPIGVSLDNIDEVLELIGNPAAYTSVVGGNYATVNFANTGVGGRYAGSVAYPGLDLVTDYNHVATEAHARITIPSAGDWTFGISSNEGFLLQVGDFEMQRLGTGSSEQLATFTFSAAGTYDLHLYNFERTGSTWLELYAAPGAHAAWSAGAFDMVGDVANGGLAVQADLVGSSGASIAALLGTNVQAPMLGTRTSFYTRIPFNVTDPSIFEQLKLRMKYDDAFVAYINGVEVARRNFVGTPAWNSAAGNGRTGDEVLEYEEIDVSAFLSSLNAGANVLAIHGMNVAANDPDLLVLPELEAIDVQANSSLAYFTTPTPGAANGEGVIGFVGDVQFSVDRGFYNSPFSLTLSSATPGSQIYYTTNGDEPTQSAGTLYTGPIAIGGTSIVRAVAFRAGYLPSNSVSQTYLFLNDIVRQTSGSVIAAGFPTSWGGLTTDYGFDPDVIGSFDANGNPIGGDLFGGAYAATIKNDLKSIPTLSLVMDIDDMFGSNGIYTNSTQHGAAWERPVSAEWITDDGSLEFQVNAGLRIQGGYFRLDEATKKHSLRLLFKNQYGPGKLAFPIFGNGDDVAGEFNTIVLRAGANDGYSWNAARFTEQYMRDQFGRSLQQATGNPAAHGTFVHLYINGVYWGLYNPVERPDNEFGASYHGGNPDNWDSIHVTETPAGDDVAWNAMLAMAAQAGGSLAAYMELQGKNLDGTRNPAIAPLLNVESYIDYIALNVWGGNWDWPFKNYWAGRDRDPATTTGFEFFTWDFENTMGNNRDRSPLNATTLDQSFTGSRNAGQAHSSLKSNLEYRMAFADHAHKMFFNGGVLTPANLVARYAAIAAEVERAMVAESARWGDQHYTTQPLTLANWQAERDWLLNTYLPQRSAIVLQELKNFNLYPNLVAPTFSQHGGQVTPGFDLTVTAPTGEIWYTLDGNDPRAIGGAVSPTAILLSPGATIDIPTGLTLKARALSGGNWSALNEAKFLTVAPADASNLRIAELHYNPAPFPGLVDSQDLEFIELLNPSNQPVSLDGVQITQFAATPYAFPNGITLGPGQRLVVAKNPTAFANAYGAGIQLAPDGYGAQSLSNGGERIALLGSQGQTIQDFTYDDVGSWPAAADGGGKSLEIVNPLGNPSDPLNWRASFYAGGSPGTAGTPPAIVGDFDGDGDADGNDFLAWQRGMGTPALQGSAANGDANGDRAVNGADLALWASNFGSSAIGSSETTVAVASSSAMIAAPTSSGTLSLAADQWIAPESVETAAKPVNLAARRRAFEQAFEAPPAQLANHPFWSRQPHRATSDAEGMTFGNCDAADDATALDVAFADSWEPLRPRLRMS